MPVHHPSLELLLDYAAGSTGEAAGLALATHLALCPECREVVAQLELVGGALLEAIQPAAVPSEALDSLLARLDKPFPVPDHRSPADAARPACCPTRCLSRCGVTSAGTSGQSAGSGSCAASSRPILSPAGADRQGRARLLRIAPGVRVPRHTHDGTEMTLVLAGGFSDGDKQYQRGDFSFATGKTITAPWPTMMANASA